jgi:hypothetical protein
MNRRIVLIGATGTFGSRLAALLSAWPGIELVLAARRPEPLEMLRESLVGQGAPAAVGVARFDRSQPETLAGLSPWLVVDAAGPFQDSDYGLALAAVGCGAHYVDLADGRAFVAGFAAAVGPPAAKRGVLAVTGASSTPALSHAALAPMVDGWTRLDEIMVAISPGARAPRGLSVVEAILSYVGRPVRVFRDGDWGLAPGWSGLRRVRMPGLGRRLVSLCETPDLDLLPARFPVRDSALFMAGLELPVMHLGLTLLSLPVRWGWAASLRPLARPLRALADLLSVFGSDRGGMVVQATGRDASGRRVRARWALWAERNAGPSTPVAAAAAMIRALLDGREITSGAGPCVGLLTRDDILRELKHLPIRTRSDETAPDDPVMFRRLLGRRFDLLPPAVREVHSVRESTAFAGAAVARSGRSLPALAARLIMGTPGTGRHPVQVKIRPGKRGETWSRRFGASGFKSRLSDAARMGVFEERFGPLRFAFDIHPTQRGFAWRLIGWSFMGLSLPIVLAPGIRAAAEEADGRYRFRVVVAHRWIGLMFAYRGWLVAAR